MRLIELIKRSKWDEIEQSLLKYYKNTIKDINNYKNVYNHLLDLMPIETKFKISFEEVYDKDFDDEVYVSVSGKDGSLNKESSDFKYFGSVEDLDFANSPISYSLSLTDWKEWLGMELDKASINNYNNTEIIAHCLWEMTFYGFDQCTILEHSEELKRRVDEVKNMREEEIKEKLNSWDDIKNDL